MIIGNNFISRAYLFSFILLFILFFISLNAQLITGSDSISTNWPNMTYFDFSAQMGSNDSVGTNFWADFRGTSNEGLNFGAENTQIPGRRYLRYAINGNLDTVTTVPEWTGAAPWVTVSWDWPDGTSGQPVKVGELWVVYTREGHYACMQITYTDSANGQPGFGTYFKFNYKYQPNGTRDLTGVIPVELSAFTASVNQNNVSLNWSTASETNNLGFNIEKSSAGLTNWKNIGFVSGKGTTSEQQNYSYEDANLLNGKYFYRLKQIDLDGKYEYSNVIEVNISSNLHFAIEQNYPNPFNPSTSISYSIPNGEFVSIKVFSILGEEVATLLNGDVEAGKHTLTFDASKLSSGMYLYKITAGSFTQVKKMLLAK
jgi:hypothetical protein